VVYKYTAHKTSLAESLRGNRGERFQFKDILYDIFNEKFFNLKHRRRMAAICFSAGVLLSFSTSPLTQSLSLPPLLTRLNMAGFLVGVLPLLALAYVIERVIRLHSQTKGQISPVYKFIFIASPLILLLLDSGLSGAAYNICNLFFFTAATALLWPLKKRRSYYTKKHIDKRTK
jgi:hypothetical protein